MDWKGAAIFLVLCIALFVLTFFRLLEAVHEEIANLYRPAPAARGAPPK